MPDLEPGGAPSPRDVRDYREDGVVCVRSAVPPVWLDRLRRAVDRVVAEPSPRGRILSRPDAGFTNDVFLSTRDPDFAAFALGSPLGAVAAALLGESPVRLFHDHVFVKEPGSPVVTPWHHDQPFWPVAGGQMCSTWVALDPVGTTSGSLEFVRGSHRWPERFVSVSRQAAVAGGRPGATPADGATGVLPPDIDRRRHEFDLVSWELEPGDVLAFDPLIVHGAAGNASEVRRRAVSHRWLGSGVRYQPTPDTFPLPPGHGLTPGDLVDGPLFPLVPG